MKSAMTFLASVLVLLLAPYVAHSQDATPNMLGFWDLVDGELSAVNSANQYFDGDQTLEFTSQQGRAFTLVSYWSMRDDIEPVLDDGVQETNQGEEHIIGVFNSDGTTFIAVNHPDRSYMFGRMISEDRLELVTAESGEFAVAAIGIYERRE